jgi:hypothetical protein
MSKVIDERLGVYVDIEVVKGRSFNKVYEAMSYNGDTLVPFEFSGYTGAVLEVRKKPTSNNIDLNFNTTDGTILLLESGQFLLNKNYIDMDKLRSGVYHYDMYLINAAYPRRDFIYGKFIVFNKISE